MIGDLNANKELAQTHGDIQLYVPLQFFCCRNNGLALPLIALQYHDVRVNFDFAERSSCVNYRGTTAPKVQMTNVELLVDTHFLDTDERKRFAQSSHEYLIEQVQFTGNETVNKQNTQSDLHFNHPCKALFWTLSRAAHSGKSYLAYHPDPVRMAELNTIYGIANQNVCPNTATLVSGVQSSQNDKQALSDPASGNTDVKNKLVMEEHGRLVGELKVNGTATLCSMVYVGHPITSDAAIAANHFDPDDFIITGPVADILPASDMVAFQADITLASNVLTEIVHAGTTTATTVNAGKGQNATWADYNVTLNLHDNYSGNVEKTKQTLTTVDLQLNGHDRFKQQDGDYFVNVQSNEHWPHSAAVGIHSYSFALNPAEHQPSGTCNMSRIDNARLVLDVAAEARNTSTLRVYATNYNVLRVMSGMGGIAYSN